MHSPATISGLLYAFTIITGSFVAAAPLCYNTIVVVGGNDTIAAIRDSSTTAIVGGSSPNNSKLSLISRSVVKGF
jgi:ABC-type tungstate transport system permease subunit